MPIIEINNVIKRYMMGMKELLALSGATFSVDEGEFITIMGTSGSGKTTLLNILGTIDSPSAGEVKIKGQTVAELNDNQKSLLRRKSIGFIFQFFNLLPTLTAFENAALPLLIDGKNIQQCEERVNNVLASVDMLHRVNHKPDELSGGEQQRVAIARALLNNPDIILADEPTGNLDSISGREIFEILRKISDTQKKSVIVVSHAPMAIKFCDRALFLKDGRIGGEETIKGKKLDEDFITTCIKKYLG